MTMFSIILMTIISLFGFILLVGIFYSLFIQKEGKNCLLCFATTICSLIVICCWLKDISKFVAEFLTGYFIYFIVVSALKYITSLFLAIDLGVECNRKEKIKNLLDLFLIGSSLFIVSPDYGITYLCKNVTWNTKGEARKKQIQNFNSINLVFSVLFVIILSSLLFFKIDGCVMQCMRIILNIRIVSRTIEVIVSFVKDICSKDKSSSLKPIDRIFLAFISVVEVVVLAFGTGFCSGIASGSSLSEAACQALLILKKSIVALGC